MSICARCAAPNSDGARFCNQCGSRLEAVETADGRMPARSYTPPHLAEKILGSRAAMQGERKRVTVLFADIKGSTSLAEAAGAESWHAILDRYFAILGSVVHRFEGTINQYTGDGIMALFGAPLALEDHARRACLAALTAQAEVRRYADELRLANGLNLSMRIGLNSGEVIVGRIGDDLRMDYTAQGHTVNLAARMEQICEPGRIYCTRATATLVEGYLRLRDLGDTAVDGARQPVRVFEVEGEGAANSRLERGLARGATTFIGREAELAQLRAALDEAVAGHGQIVAVTGEAGIGKSRLCHEFMRDCERRDIARHRASGVPYAAALPLLPIVSLARSRLGLSEALGFTEVRLRVAGSLLLFDPQAVELLDPLLDFLGAGIGAAEVRADPAADRERVFEFLARFLPQAEAPQVLLVEDLHFADPASTACLAALARRVAGTSTLLVFNFRPDFKAPWLDALAPRRVALRALEAAALERLTTELLGAQQPGCTLAAELHRRAAGNPLFVEEAVQALVDSGHLAGARGAYTVTRPIAEWPVAETVHALLAARIDRLDEPLKLLLQAAAVIGQGFTVAALARLAAIEPENCRERLARLAEQGLLSAQSGGEDDYRFVHPLMQDVAYRTQLESRRGAAHRQLAAQLESQNALDAPPTAAALRIAHHWRRAGEWARAGEWNLHAARWAIMRDARTAEQQQRLALENLARAPRTPRVDHLRVVAHAGLVRQMQFASLAEEEIERHYAEGRALAEANGDTAGLAELLISYSADQLRRGDAHAAVNLALQALQLASASGVARELVGRFRISLLLTASIAGYPREGIAMLNAASGAEWLEAPVGADNYLSRGLWGYMLGWLGQLDEAAAHQSAAIEYAERSGASASWMYANQVELAWLSGESQGTLARARLALQRAEAFGSTYFRVIALRALGSAHLQNGAAIEALPLLRDAAALVGRGSSAHVFEANTLATLARAEAGVGDFERARASAEAAIASAQGSASRVWEIGAWLALFELPPGDGLADRAAQGIGRVAELLEITGAEATRPWWWLAHARWAASPAEARAARIQAHAAFERIGARAHAHKLALQTG